MFTCFLSSVFHSVHGSIKSFIHSSFIFIIALIIINYFLQCILKSTFIYLFYTLTHSFIHLSCLTHSSHSLYILPFTLHHSSLLYIVMHSLLYIILSTFLPSFFIHYTFYHFLSLFTFLPSLLSHYTLFIIHSSYTIPIIILIHSNYTPSHSLFIILMHSLYITHSLYWYIHYTFTHFLFIIHSTINFSFTHSFLIHYTFHHSFPSPSFIPFNLHPFSHHPLELHRCLQRLIRVKEYPSPTPGIIKWYTGIN